MSAPRTLAQKQATALYFASKPPKPKPQGKPPAPRRIHEKHVKRWLRPEELPPEELQELRERWTMCYMPMEGEAEAKACWLWHGPEGVGPWLTRGTGEERRELRDGLYEAKGPIRGLVVRTSALVVHFMDRRPLPKDKLGWEYQRTCEAKHCCNPAHFVPRTRNQIKDKLQEERARRREEKAKALEEDRGYVLERKPTAPPRDFLEDWLAGKAGK